MQKTEDQTKTKKVAVEVEVLEGLTPDEERERHWLELRVDKFKQAFYDAGKALRELREHRLYKSTHKKFEDYCRARFDFSRDKADLLIKAVGVMDNLKNDDNCRRFLPTAESQIRDLANFTPTEQCQIYAQAVGEAGDQVPTRQIVRGVVQQLKEKPVHLASDYCQPGEVFFLQRLAGAESRYNGCWAVAIEVDNRFTVKAAVYKGFVEVRQDQMKQIDSEQSQAQIREVYERIKRLMECQLDPIDEAQIEFLCRRPWFTPRQKQVLGSLEKFYLQEVGEYKSYED